MTRINSRLRGIALGAVILILVCLFIVVSNLSNNCNLSQAFLAVSGTLVAWYIGYLQLRLEDDRIFKDLFEKFNMRYDHELNDLINGIRIDSNDFERELSNKEKQQLLDYFNLCAEEFLWFKKGRIPADVWNAWRTGILRNISTPQIRTFYEQEVLKPNIKDSFYGLVEELKLQ